MNIGKASRRCGNCDHRQVDPNNLAIGACHGMPPQLVVIGLTARGQPALQKYRPNMEANEPACSLWQLKVAGDATDLAEAEALGKA